MLHAVWQVISPEQFSHLHMYTFLSLVFPILYIVSTFSRHILLYYFLVTRNAFYTYIYIFLSL